VASSRFGIVEAALRVKGCGGVTRHKAGTVMDSAREAMIVKRHQSSPGGLRGMPLEIER
jgi:hypothetical protein